MRRIFVLIGQLKKIYVLSFLIEEAHCLISFFDWYVPLKSLSSDIRTKAEHTTYSTILSLFLEVDEDQSLSVWCVSKRGFFSGL